MMELFTNLIGKGMEYNIISQL